MLLAATTDLSYTLLALFAPPSTQPILRWWAQHRYRALAAGYETYIAEQTAYGAPLDAALTRIRSTPQRVLDVSTGTGYAAAVAARRYPSAAVAACDVSLPMAQHAQRRLRPGTVVCADGATLPFADGAFDLVILQNAPPSLRELARIVTPGGSLVLAFSTGASLPEWVRSRLLGRLRALGFPEIAWGKMGTGLFLVADRSEDVR